MLKISKKTRRKGSVLVITTILMSFLLILLGGLTSAVLISKNANIHVSKNEIAKVESTKSAYSYYNKLVDGSYFESKETYKDNIKEEEQANSYLYYVFGYDSKLLYKTTLQVHYDVISKVFNVTNMNVSGVN